jgi:cell filamentation protein
MRLPRMFIVAGAPGGGKSSFFALSGFAGLAFNADDRAAELNGGSYENIPTSVRAADLMVDLNGVHPFREGNGRTQRVFIEALAQRAGHSLDFSVVSRERIIQASIAGNENGDPSMMRRLFREISDPVRVAALSKAIASLDQHKFAWNDRYIATAEPGHKVDVRLAGIAGDQFMARTQTAILIGKTTDLPEQRPEQGQEFTLEPSVWV